MDAALLIIVALNGALITGIIVLGLTALNIRAKFNQTISKFDAIAKAASESSVSQALALRDLQDKVTSLQLRK